MVEHIITHRISRSRVEYIVRWKGYDETSDYWLTKDQLKSAADVLKSNKRKNSLI